MANFDNQVAVVTGSSRGIGRATAERLAADGASVVVNYNASEGAAEEVVAGIEADGGTAIAVEADVSDLDDIDRLFETAAEEFGVPDIVVNVAGRTEFGPVADVSEEAFDRAFDLNAKGAFFVLQAAAQRIEDGGRIVNVSSAATADPGAGASVYLGSKAAGEVFVRALAEEVGDRGVRVNTVAPGLTDTDGLALPPDAVEETVERTPLGRLGQPEDIADAVAAVVSDDGRWITGQTIRVTGGLF